jgi:hypothetical protein
VHSIHRLGLAALIAAAALIPASLEAAVQTQTRTTAGSVTAGGTWTNPTNAASIDGACALGDGSTSTSLTITNWSFGIPAGSTILGITVRSVSSFNDVSTQDAIRLTKASAPVGSTMALNGPGTQSIPSCGSPIPDAGGLTVGGASDLWGTTWTLAEINATGFGVFYDNDFSNTAVDGVEITVTYDDGIGPSVTIDQAIAQTDPTSSSPIDFTAVFSAGVTGFDGSDIDFTGSTAAGTLVATVTGGPASYNVAVSGMTGSGTVVVSIPADAATDGVNGNDASTSTDNTVTFAVPVAPSVTIDQAAGQADPTSGSPIDFTAVFSAGVTGFDGSDIDFTGSTVGGTLVATVTGGPSTYNVAVSGMTGGGDVVVSIPADAATDGATGNTASTSTDNTVTFLVSVPALPLPVLIALILLMTGVAAFLLRRRVGMA